MARAELFLTRVATTFVVATRRAGMAKLLSSKNRSEKREDEDAERHQAEAQRADP